jgi:hypothetical protein
MVTKPTGSVVAVVWALALKPAAMRIAREERSNFIRSKTSETWTPVKRFFDFFFFLGSSTDDRTAAYAPRKASKNMEFLHPD